MVHVQIRTRVDPLTRWWTKVDIRTPDECWPWTAGTFHYGHGCFSVKGKSVPAHRWGYSQLVGPIPSGLFVCHSCDNPPCCNPRHWFLGTALDNMRDKVAKGRHRAPGPTNPASGERNGRCKLTTADVALIRSSSDSKSALARRFGIGRTQIRRILEGESW